MERVADRYPDTMGYAVVGPRNCLASGHPDPREDLPVRLGLIESNDAAKTWIALSLQGRRISTPLSLRVTGSTPTTLSPGRSSHPRIAVSGPCWNAGPFWTWQPTRPTRAWCSRPPQMAKCSAPRTVLRSPPSQGHLDSVRWWQPNGPLVGIGADGAVRDSEDEGASWATRGKVEGEIEALDATNGRWHAATSHGTFESNDHGQTWKTVLRIQP